MDRLHWLPIRARVDFWIRSSSISRLLRSSDQSLVTDPRTNVTNCQPLSPVIWNAIPLSVRVAPHISTFNYMSPKFILLPFRHLLSSAILRQFATLIRAVHDCAARYKFMWTYVCTCVIEWMTGTTMDTTRLQKGTTTKEYLEKRPGEKMWNLEEDGSTKQCWINCLWSGLCSTERGQA